MAVRCFAQMNEMRVIRSRLGSLCVALAAMLPAACGRQVSPNPIGIGPGGTSAGEIAVFFNVAAPFNFSQYQYWAVFNTSGNGGTPDTMPWQNNYANYSIAVRVSGTGGSTSAVPGVYLRNAGPGSPVNFQALRLPSQQFQYLFNDDGSGTQFEVIFSRAALVAAMGAGAPQSKTWSFNAFTTEGNLQGQATIIDSLGRGGAVDPQFSSPPLATAQSFDVPLTALYSGNSIDPAAQITSAEIANNP
jgi:hypothetical protein